MCRDRFQRAGRRFAIAAMRRAGCLLAWVVLVPAPAGALDFAGVLNEVQAVNPRLNARRWMEEAARRRVRPAGAWSSPMVEVGVENLPTDGRFDVDPMTMKVIGVTQRVPISGANGLARGAARATYAAETSVTRAAEFELAGDALEAYADAFYAGLVLHHTREHQVDMDRLVGSVRGRYESGSGRLDELLRAESERARTRADLAAALVDEEGAWARLDALRGRTPGAAREELDPPPTQLHVPARDEWLEAVRSTHPRLAGLDARIESYRLSARAQRRAVWPDLEVHYVYGQRGAISAEGIHGALATDDQLDMASTTVSFTVPLFAGARELSQAGEMDALERATIAERREAELDLRRQVVAAQAEAEAAQRTIALLADTVLATERRALEASWASYRAGSTDLARVMDATHAVNDEIVATLQARRTLARAEARLLALTGRGDLFGVPLERKQP